MVNGQRIVFGLGAGILPVLLSAIVSAHSYNVIQVEHGGTIEGRVTLDGPVPEPKGFNLITFPDPAYCGRISNGRGWRLLHDFVVDAQGGLKDAIVFLEGVQAGKPFEMSVPLIEARDCLFQPFMTVVRNGHAVEVINMDPVMHDIQAYETSHLGPRVLFNVPLPMNPLHPRDIKDASDAAKYHRHLAGEPMKQLVKMTKGRRVFVMQCGFHAYMETWGVAVTNPYFAKTDEHGRFVIDGVPAGTYKLVIWHPYVRTAIERTVTVVPKGLVEADIVVQAPTGRLYANEVMDHPYVRYNVPEDTRSEIDPMVKRQEH